MHIKIKTLTGIEIEVDIKPTDNRTFFIRLTENITHTLVSVTTRHQNSLSHEIQGQNRSMYNL